MRMSRKKKTIWIVSSVLAVCMIASVVVFAAYYGKGNFKDVFVNRKNYFSSDMLVSVPSEAELPDAAVLSGGTEKIVNFYNYDLSTGEYNEFDLTFAVYAWLSDTSSGRQYTLTYNGETVTVGESARGEPVFRVTLAGGKASVASLMLSFGITDETDLSALPKLYLWAVPEAPAYLSARTLGALITPSLSDAFRVDGYFEHAENADIEDYAAFRYLITMSGEPPVGGKLRLKWSSAALTLVTENRTLPDGAVVTDLEGDDKYDKYIEFAAAADFFCGLTFLRVQNAADEDNPWADAENPVTWEMLGGYVAYEER